MGFELSKGNPTLFESHAPGFSLLWQGTPQERRGVFIEPGDVRAKRMARKAGSLIVFVVDASGSMALNRMNAAKGAAMSLLQEAYKSRDKICIIPFQVGKGKHLGEDNPVDGVGIRIIPLYFPACPRR